MSDEAEISEGVISPAVEGRSTSNGGGSTDSSSNPENNNNNNNNNNNSLHNKILLVDDEPDITAVFTLGLEDHGFKVDTFNDPLQALSDFKTGSYDLALIDHKMCMNPVEYERGHD